MNATSSREHLLGCLTRLRAAFTPSSTDDPRRIQAQNDIYARELERLHPQAVKAACEQAARDFESFPSIKRLLAMAVVEHRALADRTALRSPGTKPTVVERVVARHGGLALTRLDYGALSKLFDLNVAGKLDDETLDARVLGATW